MDNHDMSWAAKPERSSADEHCKRVNADEMTPTTPSPISDQAAGEPKISPSNLRAIARSGNVLAMTNGLLNAANALSTAPTAGSAPVKRIGAGNLPDEFRIKDPEEYRREMDAKFAASTTASVLTDEQRDTVINGFKRIQEHAFAEGVKSAGDVLTDDLLEKLFFMRHKNPMINMKDFKEAVRALLAASMGGDKHD